MKKRKWSLNILALIIVAVIGITVIVLASYIRSSGKVLTEDGVKVPSFTSGYQLMFNEPKTNNRGDYNTSHEYFTKKKTSQILSDIKAACEKAKLSYNDTPQANKTLKHDNPIIVNCEDDEVSWQFDIFLATDAESYDWYKNLPTSAKQAPLNDRLWVTVSYGKPIDFL